jgi:hypothetical protein
MDIDALIAHTEIRQVLYRYCRGVDRGDEALIRSVYHPDAEDDHGTWQGPGQEFARYIVAALDDVDAPSQHHVTNVLIELDGNDRAAVESYFIAFHPYASTDGGIRHAFVGGRYLDDFERRSGEWRISRRRVVLDWTRSDIAGEAWPAAAAFASGRRRDQDPSAELFA